MVTNVDLTPSEIDELLALTNRSDPVEAIRIAMHEYMRHRRRAILRELPGRVEMEDNWRELEHRELNGDDVR